MAEAEKLEEGAQYQAPDGTIVTARGGQLFGPDGNVHVPPGDGSGAALANPPPSTWEDTKNIAGPALKRGLMSLVSTPATLADLALRAGNAAANSNIGQKVLPEGTGKAVSDFKAKVDPSLQPNTYGGMLKRYEGIEGKLPEPQTTGGKFANTALEFLPSTMAGGALGAASKAGSLANAAGEFGPALTKGMSSALGSEGLGQVAEKYLPEWAGSPSRIIGALLGHGAPRGVTPFATDPARVAQAERVQSAIGPQNVSAAQYTKSPRLAAWQGGSEVPGQGEAATEYSLGKAGITRGAGETTEEAADRGKAALSAEGKQLAARNSMTVDPVLDQDLSNIHSNYTTNTAPSRVSPEVRNAVNDLNSLKSQGKISGQQYWDLRQEWNSSGVPAVRKMGKALDAAMERSLAGTPDAGAWKAWNDKYTNASALGKVAEVSGDVLSPKQVARALNSKNDLYHFSRAAENIFEPITPSTSSRLSGLATPVGAAIGYGAGHALHSLGGGPEMAILGSIVGEPAVRAAGNLVGGARQNVVNSPLFQAYAKNQVAPGLSPQDTAGLIKLLATPGVGRTDQNFTPDGNAMPQP